MEPVRQVVPLKIEVACRAAYSYRMNCFKIVLQDRCNNILYEQQIVSASTVTLDPCFTWSGIDALTPPPGAAARPSPPDVPDQRELPPPHKRCGCCQP